MIPLLVILEILILCLGATLFLYRPQMRVSEAICSGIIVALLTLSFVYQTVFLIGEPKLAFIVEGMLVVVSLILLKRRSNYLRIFRQKTIQVIQANKILSILVGICLIYLGLQAIVLPPTGPDAMVYHLPRVLLFQQEKSLYLDNLTTLRQAIFAVGWNILNHAFLRFYNDFGLGIFPSLIYLAIGSGTYALARQVSSQKIAIVTTLVIISMPQVVLQSTSMNTDLPLAGIAIFCFLSLTRLYQKINVFDLSLLMLGAAFGLSVKLTFALFLAPFTLFGGYLLLKKYSFTELVTFLISHWKIWIALMLPLLILSQVWLYVHNHFYWGGWSGPPDYLNHFKQADGFKGTIANAVRYLFESFDLMLPTDFISRYLWNIRLSEQLEHIYNQLVYQQMEDAGILNDAKNLPYKFSIQWRFDEKYSWYGVLGFFLAIPSIFYGSLRGNNLVRIVSIILLCFFIIVCYKVPWSPFKGRYFSLFFVSSGICIAYTLSQLELWIKSKINILLKIITITALIFLFLTMLMNEDKAIVGSPSSKNFAQIIIKKNIWLTTRFGQQKYSQLLAKQLSDLIPEQSKIALLANVQSPIYDYLLALPNATFVPIHPLSFPDIKFKFSPQAEFTNYQFTNPLKSNPESFDYLLCINSECQLDLPNISQTVIWRSFNNQAKLIKLN